MAIHFAYFRICKSSSKYRLKYFFGTKFNSIVQHMCICRTTTEEKKQRLWFSHVFLAGCTGGVIKALFACPIELSKVRLQVKVRKLLAPKQSPNYN